MVIFAHTPIIAWLLEFFRKWMALWPSTRHLAKVTFLKSCVRRNKLTFLLLIFEIMPSAVDPE